MTSYYTPHIFNYNTDVAVMVAAAMDAVLAARRGDDPQPFLNQLHAMAGKSPGVLGEIGYRYPSPDLVLEACIKVLETQTKELAKTQEDYQRQINREVERFTLGYNDAGSGAASAPNMGTTRRVAVQQSDGTWKLSWVGPGSTAPTVNTSAYDSKFAVFRQQQVAQGNTAAAAPNNTQVYGQYLAWGCTKILTER